MGRIMQGVLALWLVAAGLLALVPAVAEEITKFFLRRQDRKAVAA